MITSFRSSIKTVLVGTGMAVLLAGEPAQAMCHRGRPARAPRQPRHFAHHHPYAGHHAQAGAAARLRQNDTQQLAMRVAILAACAAGVGACWYFLGKPAISYGANTRINIAGIPINLGFGAHHDGHGRGARAPRGHGRCGHFCY